MDGLPKRELTDIEECGTIVNPAVHWVKEKMKEFKYFQYRADSVGHSASGMRDEG
jgi:hypothetical protein